MNKLDKIDWNIHAVYESKEKMEPLDIHTHGLEKHGIYNLCMECPSKDLVKFCGKFINNLAIHMIDGEEFTPGKAHLIDDPSNHYDIYHVFDIDIDTRDNGEGHEKVYVINYWFDKDCFSPYNYNTYRFNASTKQWERL